MHDSIKLGDKFDIEFTDDGNVAIEKDGSSIANMLRLDFVSNNDWILDERLGINWINSDNKGLLQLKNPEILIVKEISKKLNSTKGVVSVDEITINKTLNRKLYATIIVTVLGGEKIILETGGV